MVTFINCYIGPAEEWAFVCDTCSRIAGYSDDFDDPQFGENCPNGDGQLWPLSTRDTVQRATAC